MPRTVRAAIAITLSAALLLAGCSLTNQAATPSSPTSQASSTGGEEETRECPGATAPVSNLVPASASASLASYAAFDGIHSLTWASKLIVLAQVLAVCPVTGDSARSATEWVLQVEAVYRGAPATRIVVRDTVMRTGPDAVTGQLVGSTLLLFLSEEDDTLYATGGPQGIWHYVDGLAWAGWCCSSVAFTLAEMEQAIAFSLTGEPPEHMPVEAVSLRSAPRGLALPRPTQRPAGCGGLLVSAISAPQSSYQHSEHIADLAWYSHQIVVGTVIEQLPSQHLPAGFGSDPLFEFVVTDYVVQVEERLRGRSSETLRVRQLGGTVGDCEVRTRDEPLFELGERLLLFASTPEPDVSDPTYYPTGGRQGVWQFDASGTLVSNWQPEELDEYPSTIPSLIPLVEMLEYFSTVLTDPPPTKYTLIPDIVTPEASPLAPSFQWSHPERDPASDWNTYEHPVDGWSLKYPAGWSLTAPGTHGSVTTLTSYSGDNTPAERPPAGEVRIDFKQEYGPGMQQPEVMTVGPEQYPGILTAGADYLRVHYYAAGKHWLLTAWFNGPATLDDPYVTLFFLLADSIVHHRPPPEA